LRLAAFCSSRDGEKALHLGFDRIGSTSAAIALDRPAGWIAPESANHRQDATRSGSGSRSTACR